MQEREPLEKIRASLQRGNFVDALGGDVRLPEEKATDLYFSNSPSTGRSEIAAAPDQVRNIRNQVELVATWLMTHGKTGMNHPDCESWIEDGTIEGLEKTGIFRLPTT